MAQEAKQGGTRDTASVKGIQVPTVSRQFQPARVCREMVFVQFWGEATNTSARKRARDDYSGLGDRLDLPDN